MRMVNSLIEKLKSVRWIVVAAGLGITLAISFSYVFKPDYLTMMEYKLYDVFVRETFQENKDFSVSIVDIDEYSLEKFGQWPWPRYRIALLLQKIYMAGALAVGNDILYAEPDGKSPTVLKKMLKKDLQLDIEFSGLPQGLMDNDQVFAAILGKGPYVLGYSLDFKDEGSVPVHDPPALKVVQVKRPKAKGAKEYVIQAPNVIAPMPMFLENCSNAGYMNALADPDGVLRSVPLFASWKNNLYPHLSLATLITALKRANPGQPVVKMTWGGIESLKIGNTIIPLERNGAILVNYKGPGYTFPFVSAGHVLDDKVKPALFKNKIVFLGSSAAGLKDIKVSPLDQYFPGVEVNATIVDNIIKQDFILRPDWTPGLELILILVWGAITTFLIAWANAWLTLPLSFAMCAMGWYGGIWSLGHLRVWVSPFFPLLALVVNFSVLNLLKFWFSERKKQYYRNAFSKYVSKDVVDNLVKNPDQLALGGEEKELTVILADLRNFTTLSEGLSPTKLTHLINLYLGELTEVILDHGGTLDKYMGDAIMAFFGAPVHDSQNPVHACQAAIAMSERLHDKRKEWESIGLPYLEAGIGMNTGMMVVGNLGSARRFDYSVIGDHVNLTSRLEGLSKFYGVKIIISENTKNYLGDSFTCRELDVVKVKGKDEPIRIYELLGKDYFTGGEFAWVKKFEQGLTLYRQQEFEPAVNVFQETLKLKPRDRPTDFFINRCEIFKDDPPEPDWDGVWKYTQK